MELAVYISITRDLIKSVSNSHARYVAYLEEEKKLAEEKKKERENQENLKASELKKKEKIEQYEKDLNILEMGIESAEKAILEASCELTTIMKSSHLDKKKLHLCNSKLSMGVKRKEELVSEKSQLQSKKRKIENNPL